MADQVALVSLVEELVGIDAAGPHVVAFHRVVVEDDRLAAEDRRFDLGQALGDLMAAGGAGDPERDGAVLWGAEWAGTAPGDLLKRQAQGLGIGELAVKEMQGGVEG